MATEYVITSGTDTILGFALGTDGAGGVNQNGCTDIAAGFANDIATAVSIDAQTGTFTCDNVDDTMGISIYLRDPTGTYLAAADSSGTAQSFVQGIENVSSFDSPQLTFNWVNPAATKANWDNCRVEYVQHYVANMKNDDGRILGQVQPLTIRITGDVNRTLNCPTANITLSGQQATASLEIIVQHDFSAANAGDHLYLVVASHNDAGTSTSGNIPLTPPTGWTQVYEQLLSYGRYYEVLRKVADGTEGVETFGFSGTNIIKGGLIVDSGTYDIDSLIEDPSDALTSYRDLGREGFTPSLDDVFVLFAGFRYGATGGTSGPPRLTTTVAEDFRAGNSNQTSPVYSWGLSAYAGSIKATDGDAFGAFQTRTAPPSTHPYQGMTGGGTSALHGIANGSKPSYSWDGTAWTYEAALFNFRTASSSLAMWGTTTSAIVTGNAQTTTTDEWNGTTWSDAATLPFDAYNGWGSGTDSTDGLLKRDWSDGPDVFEYDDVAWAVTASTLVTQYYGDGSGTPAAGLAIGGHDTGGIDNPITNLQEYNGTAWSTGDALTAGRQQHNAGGTATDTMVIGGGRHTRTKVGYQNYYGGLLNTETYNGTAWATGPRPNYAYDTDKENASATGAASAIRINYTECEMYDTSYSVSTDPIQETGVLQTVSAYEETYTPDSSAFVSSGGWTKLFVYEAVTNVVITPGPDTINITGQEPDVRIVPFKPHTRALKAKFAKLQFIGLAPTFDNTVSADAGLIEGITESLTLTGSTASIGYSLTVTGTTATIALTESAADIGRTRTVSAATESVTVTGTTATIGRSRDITCTTETVSATATASTVTFDRPVVGATEVLQLAANQALTARSKDVVATTEALALGFNAAAVLRGRNVAAGTEALQLLGNTATLSTDRVVAATTAQLALTGNTADLTRSREVSTTTEALTLTGQPSVVKTDRSVAGATEQLTVQATVAQISRGSDLTATCTPETLTLTGSTAAITTDRPVVGVTEQLTLTEAAATVTTDRDVSGVTAQLTLTASQANTAVDLTVAGATAALTLTGSAATVTTDRPVTGATEQLTLTGSAAAVATDRDVAGAAEQLTLTTTTASLGFGSNLTVTGATAALTLTGNTATIDLARDVSAATEQLALTGSAATVSADNTTVGQTEALQLTTNPAQISTGSNRAVACTTEQLALSPNSAEIRRSLALSGTTEQLTLTATPAAVDAARVVAAATEQLVLTETAATVDAGADLTVACTTGQLLLTETAATIELGADLTLDCATGQLTITGNNAAIGKAREVAATTASVTLSTPQAAVDRERTVLGQTASVLVTANTALVVFDPSRDVVATSGVLRLSVTPATVRFGTLEVTATTEALTLTGSTALITKLTVSNTLARYGREGVEIWARYPDVLVTSSSGVLVLPAPAYGATVLPDSSN